MTHRLGPLLKLALAITSALVLLDAVIFRSGAYTSLIEFDSTAGSVVMATKVVDHYYDTARKNVLVLGNSQVGEGFSAALADEASARPDVHFLNGSIAGTTPRLWNYLLRRIDPEANRFAAIVMMIDYGERYQGIDLTNYPLDTSYALPLLQVSDLLDYPSTFTAANEQARARRAILFPLQALHEDVLGLLAHPLRRAHQIAKVRPDWIGAIGIYPGRDGNLPDLPIDAETGLPTDWGADPAKNQATFADYFRDARAEAPADLQASNLAYAEDWVGRIARRYREKDVPVIVFCMPRGPWKTDLQGHPSSTSQSATSSRRTCSPPCRGTRSRRSSGHAISSIGCT